MVLQEKMTFDTSVWDGSPSNWDSAEAYCSDCLIDTNSGDSPKTKDKCALPYRKSGSSQVNINALRTMASGRGLPAVNAPAADKKKAARWLINIWPKAFNKPAPKNIYDIAGESMPVSNRSTIYKDNAGQMWFFGVYSNNFEDKVGDILTEAAHEEYAQWVKSTGVRPPITIAHQPTFPPAFHLVHLLALLDGQIDANTFSQNLKELYSPYAFAETTTVIPLNGFTFVLGKVYDNKRSLVESLLPQLKSWGMSHGFIRLQSNGNIINKYRTFEFSILPDDIAANWATSVGLITKGGKQPMNDILKSLSQEDQDTLQELLNAPVEELESATSKARTILQQLLSSKGLEEVEVEPEEETTEVVEEDVVEDTKSISVELRSQIFEDLKIDELVQTLKSMGDKITSQEARIETLVAEIETLKATEDEKIALQFQAPNWSGIFAEKSGTTDKDKLKEIKENLPEEAVAEKVDPNNPLSYGFWGQFAN